MNSDPSGYFTLGDFSVSNAISGIISQTYNASFAMAVWSGFIGGLVAVGDQLSTGNYDPYDLFFAFGDGAVCGFAFGLVAQFMPIKILMALSGLGIVGGFAGAIQSFSDGEFWQGIYRTSLSALGGVGFWKAFGCEVKGYLSALHTFKSGAKVLSNFDVSNAYVKPKHLLTSGGKGKKFLGNSKIEAENILKSAIKNGKVVSIKPNKVTKYGNKSYQIFIDAEQVVGTKGEHLIVIILSSDGGMISAYPVKK